MRGRKPLKRLVPAAAAAHTQLKQGVNERIFLQAYALARPAAVAWPTITPTD
jgi:hypothetical protein